MLKSTIEFVYIDVNEGIGKNSGKPYKFVKLANPLTFQNYSMPGDVNVKFPNFRQGDRVGIITDLVDNYGRTDLLVTNIFPFKNEE